MKIYYQKMKLLFYKKMIVLLQNNLKLKRRKVKMKLEMNKIYKRKKISNLIKQKLFHFNNKFNKSINKLKICMILKIVMRKI